MKTTTFSSDAVDKPSLNFHLLREEGLAYLQKIAGDHWTDYNAHDPGVTILEQLCFALTDVAYRLEYPIADLLALPSDSDRRTRDRLNNAFFEASRIFSSHAVTVTDQRKMLIDAFGEIQNVWYEIEAPIANEEKMILTKGIEILPNLLFNTVLKTDRASKEAFLSAVHRFLSDNRNLAEDIATVTLLKSEQLNIHMELFLEDEAVVEEVITKAFIALFELLYRPVHYHSASQLMDQGYDTPQLFSGPILSKGIVKDETLKERVTELTAYGLQKLLTRVDGVIHCKISSLELQNGQRSQTAVRASKGHFLHLLEEDGSALHSLARFTRLFENLKIYNRDKEVAVYDKNKIVHWIQEIWSKKYRQYPQAATSFTNTNPALEGRYRDLGQYHSIQHHFPMIYGVGSDGVSSHEPLDRQGKAKQLKGYLMLFEQHLANYLAQIAQLNRLFSIDFDQQDLHSYFHQQLTSVPEVSAMYRAKYETLDSVKALEKDTTFYDRKNRIYDHLLARFGEELNPLPWKIGYHLHVFSSIEEYQEALLYHKSQLLKTLESLSYYRVLGERFAGVEVSAPRFRESKNGNNTNGFYISKKPLALRSGLAAMVAAKMGFANDSVRFTLASKLKSISKEGRARRRLAPKPTIFANRPKKLKIAEEQATNTERYEPLAYTSEIEAQYNITADECVQLFGRIALKKMFKRGLDIANYRVSRTENDAKKEVTVIFNANKRTRWIQLMSCANLDQARQRVSALIRFLKQENSLAEGLYVVDHILLRDFVEASTTGYGLSFLGIDDAVVFELPQSAWASSKEQRDALLSEICTAAQQQENFVMEDNVWILKGCSEDYKGKPILTYHMGKNAYNTTVEQADVARLCKEYINLFYDPTNDFGRLRLKEVEGIRFRGDNAKVKGVKGQRRLVFQRKLDQDNLIVNEDFFNLKITVILPNWSARFQDRRFLSYLKDVIRQRTPAHIQNDIVSLGVEKMYHFEKVYFAWRKAYERADSDKKIKTSKALYHFIQQFKHSSAV